MASRNITVYNTTAYRLTAEEMATLQVLHLWFFISSELWNRRTFLVSTILYVHFSVPYTVCHTERIISALETLNNINL